MRFLRSIPVGIVVVAAFAAPFAAGPTQMALADKGGQKGHNFQVIFTKCVTSPGVAPVLFNMAGVVSGDVGGGQYVGEVLELTSTEATTTIKALYHLNGGAHQLTAQLTVVQDNKAGTAVLKGVVTDGWMKGAKVRGDYQVIAPCGILNANGPFGDICFQGTLRINREHDKNGDH
jgi:hypothetical protein